MISALCLAVNELFLLALVAAGTGHLEAQAAAILFVTPFSFAANKLWAFSDDTKMQFSLQLSKI